MKLALSKTLLCLTWLGTAGALEPTVHAARAVQRVEGESERTLDLAALQGLSDGQARDLQSRSYVQLAARGRLALPVLREGLLGDEWRSRLLCAVLLARLGPDSADLARVCRTLIGHLADNPIRVDALVAGEALAAVGQPCRPFLQAGSWHATGQLAERCERVLDLLLREQEKPLKTERRRVALAQAQWDLRWPGGGPRTAPGLSAPLPTPAERLRQHFLDLGHDERRGNGCDAFQRFQGELGRTDPEEREIILLLTKGLGDADRQRRLMSGVLLMMRDVPPTHLLLTVAIESLKDDEFGSSATIPVGNATQAQIYLKQHAQAAQPFLMRALASPRVTQRLRAAAILAQSRAEPAAAYVPLLLEHLCDNDLPCDASLAGFSLSLLGPRVLPWLDTPAKDAQQAHYMHTVRRSVHLLENDPKARIPFPYGGMF